MNFYYLDSLNQPTGPVSDQALQELLETGTLNEGSLIAPEGGEEWLPLASFFQIEKMPATEARQVPQFPQGHNPAPRPRQQAFIPAGQNPLQYQRTGHKGLVHPLSPTAVKALGATGAWSIVTSVTWWISSLKWFVVGFITLVMVLPKTSQFNNGVISGGVVGTGLFFLLLGVGQIILAIHTAGFGSRISQVKQFPDGSQLAYACERQTAYLRLISLVVVGSLITVGGLALYFYFQLEAIMQSFAPPA